MSEIVQDVYLPAQIVMITTIIPFLLVSFYVLLSKIRKLFLDQQLTLGKAIFRVDVFLWINIVLFIFCHLLYGIDPGYLNNTFGHMYSSLLSFVLFPCFGFNIIVCYINVFQKTLNNLTSQGPPMWAINAFAAVSILLSLALASVDFLILTFLKAVLVLGILRLIVFVIFFIGNLVFGVKVLIEVSKNARSMTATINSDARETENKRTFCRVITASVGLSTVGLIASFLSLMSLVFMATSSNDSLNLAADYDYEYQNREMMTKTELESTLLAQVVLYHTLWSSGELLLFCIAFYGRCGWKLGSGNKIPKDPYANETLDRYTMTANPLIDGIEMTPLSTISYR